MWCSWHCGLLTNRRSTVLIPISSILGDHLFSAFNCIGRKYFKIRRNFCGFSGFLLAFHYDDQRSNLVEFYNLNWVKISQVDFFEHPINYLKSQSQKFNEAFELKSGFTRCWNKKWPILYILALKVATAYFHLNSPKSH